MWSPSWVAQTKRCRWVGHQRCPADKRLVAVETGRQSATSDDGRRIRAGSAVGGIAESHDLALGERAQSSRHQLPGIPRPCPRAGAGTARLVPPLRNGAERSGACGSTEDQRMVIYRSRCRSTRILHMQQMTLRTAPAGQSGYHGSRDPLADVSDCWSALTIVRIFTVSAIVTGFPSPDIA